MQQLKEVMERGSRSAVQQVVRWEDVSRGFKSAKLGMPCDFPTSLTTNAIRRTPRHDHA
jgi:hypothetical protein